MREHLYRSFLVSLFILLGLTLLVAEEGSDREGAIVNGYGRTKVGVFLKNGDYFLSENTLDLRFRYNTRGAAFYSNVVLYERTGELETPHLRELYMDLKDDSMDLRIGKQQVIWGKGEGVFITDIVSPKDLTQFLLPDFEEIRRSIVGVRGALYGESSTLELVWVPWFTGTLLPRKDSLWAPRQPFPVVPTILTEELPQFSLDSSSFYARYSYLGESVDMSLIGGWYWNDTPAYTVMSKTISPGVGLMDLTIQPEYYRVYSIGFAFAGTFGPAIAKAEGAYVGDKRYQGNPIVYPRGYAEKNGIHYMIGADYSFKGVTMGVQYIQEIILDYEKDLLSDRLKNMMTVALSRTFFQDKLKVELFSYIGLDNKDALVKPKLTWNGIDSVELFVGAYLFINNTGDFGQYHDRNGVYTGGKMSF